MSSWNLGGLLGAEPSLKVVKHENSEQAYNNRVLGNPKQFPDKTKVLILMSAKQSFVYQVETTSYIPEGSIGMSVIQREELDVDPHGKQSYPPKPTSVSFKLLNSFKDVPQASAVTFRIDIKGKSTPLKLDTEELRRAYGREMLGHVPSKEQTYIVKHNSPESIRPVKLLFKVAQIELIDSYGKVQRDVQNAKIVESTVLFFESGGSPDVKVKSDRQQVFKADFDFEKMGIGGLDKEFEQIFRRAFASRVFPPSAIQKLGIQHVKGMLLYGPPGTGKTLIARQIGKMLNGNEPKVVNGPEILNKFVGQSEENIRKLFADAEQDQATNGENSELHIIIFDEIDAICKQRGSSGNSTGVHDTVVNQLLSKIDGVNALNNILVIGMTNRKDMIDEALLRPGRLEVHVEISLPDEHGRQQILRIHTSKMDKNKMLDASVNIPKLAASTKNYSGAELEGVCKSAAAFALNRHVDHKDLQKKVDTSGLRVTMKDFEHALTEVQPAFGMGKESFARCLLGGFLNYGPRCEQLVEAGGLFRNEVERSSRSPLVSVLIEGGPGTGKTALAAFLATQSGFPFVRLISPEAYVGYSEPAKCAAIAKAFDDAHKSPLSIVLIDDIERLIEYSPIGPRFSNIVLQTLMILCKQTPPSGRRLLILATTSSSRLLEQLDFRRSFSAFLEIDSLTEAEISTVISGSAEPYDVSSAFGTTTANGLMPGAQKFKFKSSTDRETTLALLSAETLGIKKLLMVLFMSQEEVSEGEHYIDVDRLTKVLRDIV